jgi:hypothetical protein
MRKAALDNFLTSFDLDFETLASKMDLKVDSGAHWLSSLHSDNIFTSQS